MKNRVIHILLIVTVLAIGATCYMQLKSNHLQPDEGCNLDTQEEVQITEANELKKEPRTESSPVKVAPPKRMYEDVRASVETPAPRVEQHLSFSEEAYKENEVARQYWSRMTGFFELHEEQLGAETNQAKRAHLIRSMARHVRVDTPRTLDWAMSLDDPEEKHLAMESINEQALVGIGARLGPDESGYPRITQITELGAVASTEKIELGDYIVGKVNRDGSTIYFKDRPRRQIVETLRGKPGTEVRVLIERPSDDEFGEPHSFDVTLKRSLIVVEPPQ